MKSFIKVNKIVIYFIRISKGGACVPGRKSSKKVPNLCRN